MTIRADAVISAALAHAGGLLLLSALAAFAVMSYRTIFSDGFGQPVHRTVFSDTSPAAADEEEMCADPAPEDEVVVDGGGAPSRAETARNEVRKELAPSSAGRPPTVGELAAHYVRWGAGAERVEAVELAEAAELEDDDADTREGETSAASDGASAREIEDEPEAVDPAAEPAAENAVKDTVTDTPARPSFHPPGESKLADEPDDRAEWLDWVRRLPRTRVLKCRRSKWRLGARAAGAATDDQDAVVDANDAVVADEDGDAGG